MARYLTQHTLACLTRQGAEELAKRLHTAKGKMLVEFEAADREALEKWLNAERFHFDWVLRIEFESRDGRLEPV